MAGIARRFVEQVKNRQAELDAENREYPQLEPLTMEADDFDMAIAAARSDSLYEDLGLRPLDPWNKADAVACYRRLQRGWDEVRAQQKGLLTTDYQRGLVAVVVARNERRAA